MKVVLAALALAALPAMALAHHCSWPGAPAPAPDLATGLPAAVAIIGALAATRIRRRG